MATSRFTTSYENDKFEYLTEYKSSDPQRGVAFIAQARRKCTITTRQWKHWLTFLEVHENEVARAFKTCNDSCYIERPISSFIVPRRSEDFQTDLYPPTVGLKSAMSAGDWFDGKTAIPPRISLKGRFDGGARPTSSCTGREASARCCTESRHRIRAACCKTDSPYSGRWQQGTSQARRRCR